VLAGTFPAEALVISVTGENVAGTGAEAVAEAVSDADGALTVADESEAGAGSDEDESGVAASLTATVDLSESVLVGVGLPAIPNGSVYDLIPGSASTLTMSDVAGDYEWVKTNLAQRLMSYVIEHADGNPNVIRFLYNWGHGVTSPENPTYTESEKEAWIPLLMQWDGRWGYNDYGTGPAGLTGCAPTCLAMIGFGLTGDEMITPASLCTWAEENGYFVEGSGSSWSLITDGLAPYGISCRSVSTDSATIDAELAAGHPVVINVGVGRFSAVGHFMVLTGQDESGNYILNDPNNLENSSQTWSWTDLAAEVQAAWAFANE